MMTFLIILVVQCVLWWASDELRGLDGRLERGCIELSTPRAP